MPECPILINEDFKIENCCLCTNFSIFKTEMFGTLFKNNLHKNGTLQTPKMDHLNIVFHMN